MNHAETNGKSSQRKFAMGRVLATPCALEALEKSGESASAFLSRHARGDWGDVCPDDKRLNDEALIDGNRLLSAYKTSKGERLWVITEAEGERGYRAATTILLPDEY